MKPAGRPIRIAYVTETWPPELNGVSLTVERTVRWLRARGHDVGLVRPRQPGDPREADDGTLLTRGCVIPMYPDLRFGLAGPGLLRRRWAAERPDLVHLATPGPLAWAALAAAKALGIATTSDFRTNFHQYAGHYGVGFLSGAALGLLRRFHNLSGRTFVPTRETLAGLEAEGFQRLAVVGRGVDTERFHPAHRSRGLRASWGAADETPVLLAVGRVAAEKNVELALQAWEALRATHPDTRLVVVGDGPARAKLGRRHPDARFVGAQRGADLAAHYASADAFLFPSLTDTFGNVVLEALASGLPVIAFDTAAAGELVADGVAGRLAPRADAAAFVAATAAVVASPRDARESMRAAARDAALRTTWPDVLGRFEALLLATVTAHETPHARLSVVA